MEMVTAVGMQREMPSWLRKVLQGFTDEAGSVLSLQIHILDSPVSAARK